MQQIFIGHLIQAELWIVTSDGLQLIQAIYILEVCYVFGNTNWE